MAGKKTGAGKKQGTETPTGGSVPTPMTKNGIPVVESAVDSALDAYGLEAGGNLAQKVSRLRAHLDFEVLPKIDSDDRIKCMKCGEVGTEDTEACAFCGDAGSEDDEVVDPDDEDEPTSEAAVEPEKAPEPAAEPEPAAPAPAAKGKAKGKGVLSLVPTPKTETEANKPAESVSVDDALAAKSAELDAVVERIKSFAKSAVANAYDIGIEIKRVHDGELWKAHGHDTFKAWLDAEIPMSRSSAYRLLEIVKSYDRETYAQVGVKKLALIANSEDPDARSEALDAAKAGATTRTVRDIVETEGDDEGKRKREPESGEKPKRTREPAVTLLAKVDAAPKTYPFRSAKTSKVVKTIDADSYVEVPIGDGVVQRIAIKYDGEKIAGLTVVFVAVKKPEADVTQ